MAANGTGDAMDEVLCRFWPLMEVKPVHDVLELERFNCPDRFAYPLVADLRIIGDHWDYWASNVHNSQLYVVLVRDQPSFRDFMNRYAEDPNIP